jgi:hypothetical protein
MLIEGIIQVDVSFLTDPSQRSHDVLELTTFQRLSCYLHPHPTQANNKQPTIDIVMAV